MIGCSKKNSEIQETKYNILSKRNLGHLVLRWRPLLKHNIYLYSTQTAFEQKKPKLESKFNPGLALMPLIYYDKKIKQNKFTDVFPTFYFFFFLSIRTKNSECNIMLSKRGYLGRLPKVRTGRQLDHGGPVILTMKQAFSKRFVPAMQSLTDLAGQC